MARTSAVAATAVLDVRSAVEDVITAVSSASYDRSEVKRATARLHRGLLGWSAKTIRENEGELIEALSLFPFNRGAQVTSWLMAHSRDRWSREHWAAVEDILLAA